MVVVFVIVFVRTWVLRFVCLGLLCCGFVWVVWCGLFLGLLFSLVLL